MGELERQMQEQRVHDAEHQQRMTKQRDEGRHNLRQFVGLMQSHDIGRTTLYLCRTDHIKPPPVKRRFRSPVEQKPYFEDTFSLLGRGWEVRDYDGECQDFYVVLEDGNAYDCRLPKTAGPLPFHSSPYSRLDPPDLEQPYMVTDGPLSESAYSTFAGNLGLELLADTARKYIEAGTL